MNQLSETHGERRKQILAERRDEILGVVRGCLSDLLHVRPSEIRLDTTLLEIGAESLDFVDLVHKLERSFEIAIPWSLSIPGSQTVRSFVDAVATGLADRKASGQQPGILDHCDG